MSSINKSKVRRILTSKLGCVEGSSTNTNHECYQLFIDGKYVARTYISRGSKPKSINDRLLKRMAIQLKVRWQDFKQFCACNITREEFEEIILQRT